MKRLIDFLAAAIALVLLSPVIVVVAILIKRKLGSPVLFRQQRPGLAGRPFFLYKFRTMNDARDGNGDLLPDSQRLVGIGKLVRELSLDELPQLFNVLKGDMSLIGPRPLLMEYLPLYSATQKRRHEVRPGITGWAQVNGRNAISWEKRFELDVWYVENRTLLLDFKIFVMTILKVVRRSGVNEPGQATMRKFTGSSVSDE